MVLQQAHQPCLLASCFKTLQSFGKESFQDGILHIQEICYSQLLIATINFECSNHCDNIDIVSGNVKEDMLQELEVIANNEGIQGFLRSIAESLIDFFTCWDISLPTICCYQILIDSSFTDLKPEAIQFFCLSGYGICYHVLDCWSQCFMAISFYHCTSAAIYHIGGKIYTGNYLEIYVFAWGKGGTAENPNQKATVAGQNPPNINQGWKICGGGQDGEQGQNNEREEETGFGGTAIGEMLVIKNTEDNMENKGNNNKSKEDIGARWGIQRWKNVRDQEHREQDGEKDNKTREKMKLELEGQSEVKKKLPIKNTKIRMKMEKVFIGCNEWLWKWKWTK